MLQGDAGKDRCIRQAIGDLAAFGGVCKDFARKAGVGIKAGRDRDFMALPLRGGGD
jgi:hypothetical protein